jgi:hypothetical protein
MREACIRNRSRDTHVPAELLESVRELNHRFLDLVAMPSGWDAAGREGPGADLSGQIAPLTAAQKKAAANCPYALFDLRFHDEAHWQARLQNTARWNVSDEAAVAGATLNFVRLALFFAWHVASTRKLAAPLLLGMSDVTAAAFRSTTIDCLPALAATEAGSLTARWSGCAAYWRALILAAARPNAAELRRVQLSGLQLAAAARLP